MADYFEKETKGSSSTTNYIATGKPLSVSGSVWAGDNATFPVAKMEVRHPREKALFSSLDYDEDPDYPDFAEFTVDRLSDELLTDVYDYPDNLAEVKEQQRNTPQMFYSRPAEVTSLFADPSMRHTVGTLGGLALNQFGKTLTASDDLSRHSSRLVQRAHAAGAINTHPNNPLGESNNPIDHAPLTRVLSIESPTATSPVWHDLPGKPVSQSRLDAARKTIHGILRPKQPKTSPDQFRALNQLESDRDKPYDPSADKNAMQIPGME